MPFCIRRFQKPDFDTLWHIDQACFPPQLAYSRPELAFYMRRPGAFTLVAEANAAPATSAQANSGQASAANEPDSQNAAPTALPPILGFIVAEARRTTGHIITIDVIQATRRLGVGSALLQAAEDQLLNAGAISVALEAAINNEPAIRFYKQKGYFVEKTIRGYYSGQLDALRMVKELQGSGRI